MREGSGFYAKDVEEIMGGANAPLVALAHSLDYAKEISRRLKEKKAKEGDNSNFASISDFQNFIPVYQDAKIQTLTEIGNILPEKLRKQLTPQDKEKVEALLHPSGFKKISEKNVPFLVKERFSEKDGSVGRLILVDPPIDSYKWSASRLNQFVTDVRSISDTVEGKTVPVAGTIAVSSDLISSIVRDGPKASILAFSSVVFLIIILFRKPRIIGLMLSALVLGNVWLFGILIGADIKINFLNFIALPITFGIGVDYGVNIFDRYLHDPTRNVLRIVRETGGAVGLCSFTTVVGYSSLLIAQNQAFVSFGILAVIGELSSMIAAVIAIPSLLVYSQGRKAKQMAQVIPDKSNEQKAA